jgi:hypothetical protein
MRFLRRSDDTGGAVQRATALVVQADAPLDNAPHWGNVGLGTVRILLRSEPDPIYVARSFRMDEHRWLVRGMEVPVAIDPAQPDRFEVEWDAIPSIEERVAAGDPALADPIGAARAVVAALKAAGLAGSDPSARPDRFQESIDAAAGAPAPPGKMRAVVLIATTTASLYQRGPSGGGWDRHSWGKRDVVLAVNVPGRTPYAVLRHRFERPRAKGDVAGAGLPALVSASDPRDVEILWDELPSIESQLGRRIADEMQSARAGIALEQEMGQRINRADMQGTLAQSARMALQFVQDPAQRKMLIEQYRRAGIPIDED